MSTFYGKKKSMKAKQKIIKAIDC